MFGIHRYATIFINHFKPEFEFKFAYLTPEKNLHDILMNILKSLNKIIEYSFYLIFLLVPLYFLGNTSELFEFNKMWLTFGLTIIIASSWISKMIIKREWILKRTPLDIPIIIFLISQIISTIFSLDFHISLWGYYSRFNGGLFSTITYITLYYAFASNLELKQVYKSLKFSLISAFITVLWGFPSRFGYDPTCYVFRGTLDTLCWTEAFRPTIRTFSTLGQPAWFAAYLNILLPVAMVMTLYSAWKKNKKLFISFFLLSLLIYASINFTNTRAGFIAFIVTDIFLWLFLFLKEIFDKKFFFRYLMIFHIGFFITNFLFGIPVPQLQPYTLPNIQKNIIAYAQTNDAPKTNPAVKTGITDSSDIRTIVWRGAINAWLANPIFGTGVETFAFAYYKHRPVEHNMTSEWDYLYNKAHNEYLNYLTTTGMLGLGSYLSFIILFLIISFKYIFTHKNSHHEPHALSEDNKTYLTALALTAGFISILITNFFGFSVVIINIYFFLIPLFILFLLGKIDQNEPNHKTTDYSLGTAQWLMLIAVIITACYMLLVLFRYWYADTEYALGYNLNRSGSYQQAYQLLENAVNTIPDEPVFKDELAINLSTIASALYAQNDKQSANQLAAEAIKLSNEIVTNHPNNIIFWKNRLRIFYGLANTDIENQAKYYQESINVLTKSVELAPTDAKILYNYGVLLGQTGNIPEGIQALEKTVAAKPDYTEAYFALGLLYHQMSIGAEPAASESARPDVIDQESRQKAIDTFQFILDVLDPENAEVKKSLEEWKR